MKKNKSRKPIYVSVSDGKLQFIYSDHLLPLTKLGNAEITRVSHVEPTGLAQWEARMEDGEILGPFSTRAGALVAEVEYLERKMFQ